MLICRKPHGENQTFEFFIAGSSHYIINQDLRRARFMREWLNSWVILLASCHSEPRSGEKSLWSGLNPWFFAPSGRLDWQTEEDWFIGKCREIAQKGLPSPVNAGSTLVIALRLVAGFGNPAEHHGKSQRTRRLPTRLATPVYATHTVWASLNLLIEYSKMC